MFGEVGNIDHMFCSLNGDNWALPLNASCVVPTKIALHIAETWAYEHRDLEETRDRRSVPFSENLHTYRQTTSLRFPIAIGGKHDMVSMDEFEIQKVSIKDAMNAMPSNADVLHIAAES